MRRVVSSDVARIAELEALTFSAPWSSSALELLVTDDFPSFAVILGEDELVGYISAQRALDELQIINVAVTEELRGRGLGKLLLETAERFCRTEGIVTISLEVRASNLAAIGLYEKQGFLRAGIRHGFYRQPSEDAVVMIKNLI